MVHGLARRQLTAAALASKTGELEIVLAACKTLANALREVYAHLLKPADLTTIEHGG